jgi:demethylmenaquinone methyltransferase/2-methoxy-6-polyprenyl-1,4-benzoquinol methylase
MSFTLELFDTPVIPRVLAECGRVLQSNGRIVIVGLSKEAPPGLALKAFEWTHQHFPTLLDCRPIYVRRALDRAGFRVTETSLQHMWVPVEVVTATKP